MQPSTQSVLAIPLAWGAPTPATYDGRPAMKRTAALPYRDEHAEVFWNLYRAHKGDLKKNGVTVRRDDKSGNWSAIVFDVQPETEEEKHAKEIARELSRATDAAVAIPAPDGCEYLGYQKAGVAFAASRPATLIGDEMGLGKTIQLIGLMNATGVRSALIICPASLKLNWSRELRKWLVDQTLTIGIAASGKPLPATDVVIVNYDILHAFEDELRARTWDVIGFDEAHYLKGGKKVRRAAFALGAPERDVPKTITEIHPITGAKVKRKIKVKMPAVAPIPALRRVMLTGTPIANRPVELWPLISYLDPQTWDPAKGFFRFAMRYTNAHNNGYGWDFSGAAHLDELQEKLRSTIMVRRLKKDVLTELPAKMRQIITIPADGAIKELRAEQRAAAESEKAILAARVAAELAKAAEDDTAYDVAVERLKMLTKTAFEEMSRLRHATALAKVPYTVEHLLNIEGEKVVTFVHHKDCGAALREALEAAGRKVVMLTGDMPMDARQASVDAFQNDPTVTDFVGTIMAAGVGLTLTASSHVVFHELDWVPGNVSQAEDRCHRIGQRDSVLVQHIVLDGSVDAKLANALVAKQAVIDQALDVVHDPKQEAQDAEVLAQPIDWERATEAARQRVQEARERQEQRERVAQARDPEAGTERPATWRLTRAEIKVEAETLSYEVIAAVHEACRNLSRLDPDRAKAKNEVGWNAPDGGLGHALAQMPELTARQATLGKALLRKYRNTQLTSEQAATIFGRGA
jgi:SWI/SNF-related matrix-associated actin-dependent regulator 1 of chromatin subfamily A